MEVLTGQKDIDASALMEFFQPILDWLISINQGYDVGWDESKCPEGSFAVGKGSLVYCRNPWTILVVLFVSVLGRVLG